VAKPRLRDGAGAPPPAIPGPVPGIRTPWKRIAADLRARIERGDYDQQPKLPGAVRLGEMYGVNAVTARKALVWLAEQGLVEAVPGMGTYVRRQV
jgi:GntR family transcriptional regulator